MDQFGGRLTDELIERYSQSPNWKDGKFVNIEETDTELDFTALPKTLYERFFKADGRIPTDKISIKKLDKEKFAAPAVSAKVVWYGHSAIIINLSGKIILIDPMLGPDASPSAPFRTVRFTEDTLPLVEELPDVDIVLISHDHYDHLDMDTIEKLSGKAKQFCVALGVKRHLTEWGIDEDKVDEFDWWQEGTYDGIKIIFTPSRHFSGRGLTDKQTTLWGGWILDSSKEKIYFTGDSGYGKHFKEVGEKYGPFDLGLVECGQYDELWVEAHMTPEESVKATVDAKIKKAMPVHWGAFSLSQHPWKDPIEKFIMYAEGHPLEVCYSEPGATYCYTEDKCCKWWEDYE